MDAIVEEPVAAIAPPALGADEEAGSEQNSSNPSQQSALMMCGYLMKRSTKGDWHKRYFETSGNHLVYYKNIKMQKMLAAIALRQVGMIKMLADSEARGPVRRAQAGCLFSLDLQDRQLVLRADSLQSAEKWVACLTAIRDGREGVLRAGGSDILGSMSSDSALSDLSRVTTSHSLNESGSEYTLGPLLKPTARVRKLNQHSRLFCCCC